MAIPFTANASYRWNQGLAFTLTFIGYTIYHATRTPYAIVKSSLDAEGSGEGWAPFNTDDGSSLLGWIDTVFLSAYAVGLFISGPLGDRVNLRYFVGFGMIGSGFFCMCSGLAKEFGIHSFWFFAACCMCAGFTQSTGWPGCVTVISRWFAREGRGTLMGIWNANTSIGNIVGKLISTSALDAGGWQWAFYSMGIVCASVGVLQLLFLQPDPEKCLSPKQLADLRGEVHTIQSVSVGKTADNTENVNVLSPTLVTVQGPHAHAEEEHHQPLSFMDALRIPGVIEFSMCLFFSKLVAYALGFWLPYYLENQAGYDAAESGNISTAFDWGGVAGGVVAGLWRDSTGKSGLVACLLSILAIPCMMLYLEFGNYGLFSNVLWLFIVGLFVNGPYTLVSSAVAADLGSHPTLNGNPLAMSTVTGIIDGCGSVGAALEGVLVGYIGNHLGWDYVFYALMVMSLFCALTLVRIIRHEVCGDGSEYGEHQQLNYASQTKKKISHEKYEYVRVSGADTSPSSSFQSRNSILLEPTESISTSERKLLLEHD